MVPFRLIFALLILASNLLAQNAETPDTRIAFYNVENLFDLEDDPATHDEDFTPSGKQKWTADRYQVKLDRIGEVVSGMGYPALLGLCEVENATVLRDLCHSSNLSRNDYHFVHLESPDFRGIDVALMYEKSKFEVLNSDTIHIDFPLEVVPEEPDYTTRDVLMVEGVLNGADTMTIIVAHFPSRRGGLQASEPKRLFVAGRIKERIDEIFAKKPNAKIVMMGDFNDEPVNKSVSEILGAQPITEEVTPTQLYNCFYSHDAENLGTYNYRGNWNMLDQIMLSSSFFDEKATLKLKEATIYRQEKMMFNHNKYGATPSRTYGGPNYYGGYSDHLPVFIEVER